MTLVSVVSLFIKSIKYITLVFTYKGNYFVGSNTSFTQTCLSSFN